VTVAAKPLAIGDIYQGGKIAYIDGTGQHGLIAAAADQSTLMAWSNIQDTLVGTTGNAIGTGQANTIAIVGQIVSLPDRVTCTSGAAYACDHKVFGVVPQYSDWYLPSQDELNQLYFNQTAIGGFVSGGYYWSSSERDATHALDQIFGIGRGEQGWNTKDYAFRVRAVRSF